jgi:phosphatidylserine decarboxylase
LVYSGDEDDQIPPADFDDLDRDDETSDEADDQAGGPEVVEKRRRRLRLARLRRKSLAARAYQFSGSGTGVQGIVFMEIVRVTDLPPEKNGMESSLFHANFLINDSAVTRTSFDMDPFVVTSLGRKTLRTPVIRHNLNPVYHEKMVFQVMRHEQNYTISFTVMDRDKFSGNDFVASAGFALQNLVQSGPKADPETGLYQFVEEMGEPDPTTSAKFGGRSGVSPSRSVVSRSQSSSSLSRMARPILKTRNSATSVSSQSIPEAPVPTLVAPSSLPEKEGTEMDSASTLQVPSTSNMYDGDKSPPPDEDGFRSFTIPLMLKNRERWEDKHSPELHVKAKYLPYSALRQQFWRLMLKQYDADESGRIDKVEMTTMLDTLGSTLKESTIDSFFERFSEENEPNGSDDLSFDQAVICLEDTLQTLQKRNSMAIPRLPPLPPLSNSGSQESEQSSSDEQTLETNAVAASNTDPLKTSIPTLSSGESSTDEYLQPDDLADERGEEHVVEIRECPLCHQPRLAKRSDADIITHIATCASRDWRQVDNLVMGGFVTSSQAQRKWYSKVITKISYGGYKLGANSANILVQDRITGQINEERMSVYVRLGIRLLYKGIKSRDMEKKRSTKHRYLGISLRRTLLTAFPSSPCAALFECQTGSQI